MGFIKSCEDEPRQTCKKLPRKMCHKETVPVCIHEPKESCVEKETCKSWPKKNCEMVHKETCWPFPTKSVPRLPPTFASWSIGKNASTRLMKSARLFQSRNARKNSSKNQGKSAFLCPLFALEKTGEENENIFYKL